MNFRSLLAVDPRDSGGTKVQVLSPVYAGTRFRYLGSSLTSTAQPGEEILGGITLSLPVQKKGLPRHVVALVVYWEEGDKQHYRAHQRYPVLLEVDSSGITLDEAFVSDPSRLADIIECGADKFALRVFYREGSADSPPTIFTTQPNVPGTFYVPDGNLLCRFLVQQAEIDDLKKAAEECVAEKSAREVVDQIASLFEAKPASFRELIKFLETYIASSKEAAHEAKRQIGCLIIEASSRHEALQSLMKALNLRTAPFRTSAVREAMTRANKFGPLKID